MLCRKYNFKWDIIGKYVRIKSKDGEWYFLNSDHGNKPIKLYHQNKYKKGGWHFQCKKRDIYSIFRYIKGHDDKIANCFSKVFKIDNLLKQIEI